ncbi:MAG: hypothetical protein ACSHW0_02115 [Thalassotalea sp.]
MSRISKQLRSPYLCLLITITGLICYSFYQWQLINLNQQLMLKNQHQQNLTLARQPKDNTKIKQDEKPEQTEQKIALSFVILPKPPVKAAPISELKQAPAAIEHISKQKQLAPEKIAATATKTARIASPIKKQAHVSAVSPKKTALATDITQPRSQNKLVKNAAFTKVKQTGEQVLQQLTRAEGIEVTLAWPQDYSDYQQVLTYFEQCLGIGFGVLQGEQLLVLTPVNNNGSISHWLREVNGDLTVNEERLLINHNNGVIGVNANTNTNTNTSTNNHNQAAKYVRLFPQSFDQRLAQLISQTLLTHQQLAGQQFSSLVANFKVSYQNRVKTLALDNIKLNQQALKNSWLLHQSQC